MKEVVLDTETTGLSVKDGHRIVEIGCIELQNQIPHKVPNIQLPGCNITHFLGVQNETELNKDITYLVCFLALIKNKSAPPWNSIYRNLADPVRRQKLVKEISIAYKNIYKNVPGLDIVNNNKISFFKSVQI